jgi:hypothetical protein
MMNIFRKPAIIEERETLHPGILEAWRIRSAIMRSIPGTSSKTIGDAVRALSIEMMTSPILVRKS